MDPFLTVLSWAFLLTSWYNNDMIDSSSPRGCLDTGTIGDLVGCLNNFTVLPSYYNTSTYAAAQPTSEQTDDWTSVITSMLSVDNGNCPTLPGSLGSNYVITPFSDASTNQTFCVLSETTANADGFFVKGWGHMLVPASQSAISRSVHLSAPHPWADIGTPEQAAAIFALSGAHSVLITGRHRRAYDSPTTCVQPSSNKTTYYKTDPAHDVDEPFNIANRAIRAWQNAHGGCPHETCAYLQMHGKGASSCSADTMFISSGLGHSNVSIQWYQTHLDAPAVRLKASVNQVFPKFTAALPSDDTACDLTATNNVFGRLINGVPEEDVCKRGATADIATGQFVHVEQAAISRKDGQHEGWGEVVRRAFRTSCQEGMREDKETGLCKRV